MFSITGSRGFYMAPLSKGLLLVLNGLTVMLTLLPQYQQLFDYNLRAVKEQHHVWRLLCGRLVCLDVKDSFCSSLLIYNFRIFERRFGTRKFASYLFGTWCLSALMDFLLAQAFQFLFDYEVEELPAGLLAPVFSLFVPFYLSIPKIPVTQVMGHIHITSKSLVYIVGLQLLTSSPFMWLLALSGLISGGLYYSNVLHVQKFLFVPVWVSRIGRCTLEPVFSSSQPTSETPLGMGATLDIQRQQRMDLLDQQLLLAQYNEARRNTRPQQQPGLLQWTRLFPSLRQRGQNRPPMQPHPQAQTQPSTQTHPSTQTPPLDNSPSPSPVAEEQVARLVEMGFSRMDALEALRASNNDINMATNFLLQH
ncbi:ubiquitin-associated domain-containing protein 2 [Solea senegalensis]|uniref:Ubiquitin-associated domain-containing protein 2 n=1 Tax=Solea senegalensis TaxID=28829 RepID=A0AAV6S6I4_SOLSE|nr:ubiquitin-associated domain-containing protein 2 [Solea senegalensis]KAG7513159.1 ubiquitin-associated domain-containing protein 2 [Solea senegalensis]